METLGEKYLRELPRFLSDVPNHQEARAMATLYFRMCYLMTQGARRQSYKRKMIFFGRAQKLHERLSTMMQQYPADVPEKIKESFAKITMLSGIASGKPPGIV